MSEIHNKRRGRAIVNRVQTFSLPNVPEMLLPARLCVTDLLPLADQHLTGCVPGGAGTVHLGVRDRC